MMAAIMPKAIQKVWPKAPARTGAIFPGPPGVLCSRWPLVAWAPAGSPGRNGADAQAVAATGRAWRASAWRSRMMAASSGAAPRTGETAVAPAASDSARTLSAK